MSLWPLSDREIFIHNDNVITITKDYDEIRRAICKAQSKLKSNPNSKGGNPTKRIFIYAEITAKCWVEIIKNTLVNPYELTEEELMANKENFVDTKENDVREKILSTICIRRGQSGFRNKLINEYSGKCAVTQTNVVAILEAAHIVPYNGKETNKISNGILLRSDIHTLYDLGYLQIGEDFSIKIDDTLRDTEYWNYNGKKINLPKTEKAYPSKVALKKRNKF